VEDVTPRQQVAVDPCGVERWHRGVSVGDVEHERSAEATGGLAAAAAATFPC
jgi:hypothetical protein